MPRPFVGALIEATHRQRRGPHPSATVVICPAETLCLDRAKRDCYGELAKPERVRVISYGSEQQPKMVIGV